MMWSGFTRPAWPNWGPCSPSSRPRLKTCPRRTQRAARCTTSGVMKFTVPRSSSVPHRPQLDTRRAISVSPGCMQRVGSHAPPADAPASAAQRRQSEPARRADDPLLGHRRFLVDEAAGRIAEPVAPDELDAYAVAVGRDREDRHVDLEVAHGTEVFLEGVRLPLCRDLAD